MPQKDSSRAIRDYLIRHDNLLIQHDSLLVQAAYIGSDGSIINTPHLNNIIYVGPHGHYTTIKEAIDWFNASATCCAEIRLNTGIHYISDTVVVNQPSYGLAILGAGINACRLYASTGLAGKPMFDIRSKCDFHRISAYGSSVLPGYGSLANENFINFTTVASNYCEINDCTINGFNIAILDSIGTDFFVFNFIINSCTKGVEINNSDATIHSADLEVGNFEECDIGIDLVAAVDNSFIFRDLIFKNPLGGVGIQYDGTNFGYSGFAEIIGCSYNSVGTFLSGFDFSRIDGRDANIHVTNCVGTRDATAFAKINVIDNSATDTIATGGTYQTSAFVNTNSFAYKFKVENNKITYLPAATTGVIVWVTGNIQVNKNLRYCNIALQKNAIGSVISPFTIRTSAIDVPVSFAFSAHIESINKDDYLRIVVTTTTTGDIVKISDFNLYIEER